MNISDRKLKAVVERLAEADNHAMTCLRSAMQPGRHVAWRHGQHKRMGEVVSVIGFMFSTSKVRVKSVTSGKIMDVSAGTILREL